MAKQNTYLEAATQYDSISPEHCSNFLEHRCKLVLGEKLSSPWKVIGPGRLQPEFSLHLLPIDIKIVSANKQRDRAF
jgi:hypothetical protein